ncbi:MAG: hypothetical protein R3279_13550 [Putridiphycobacter sp.]|nr:hypothetical protein [Putridiphycobacter sp.]
MDLWFQTILDQFNLGKKVKNGASSAFNSLQANKSLAAFVYGKFKHINNDKATVPEASKARDSKAQVAIIIRIHYSKLKKQKKNQTTDRKIARPQKLKAIYAKVNGKNDQGI